MLGWSAADHVSAHSPMGDAGVMGKMAITCVLSFLERPYSIPTWRLGEVFLAIALQILCQLVAP